MLSVGRSFVKRSSFPSPRFRSRMASYSSPYKAVGGYAQTKTSFSEAIEIDDVSKRQHRNARNTSALSREMWEIHGAAFGKLRLWHAWPCVRQGSTRQPPKKAA